MKKTLSMILVLSLLLTTLCVGIGSAADLPGDVQEGKWYTDAVKYVVEQGIMSGTGENVFAPNGVVTRAAVFQSFYNLEGKPEVSGESFADVKDGDWFRDAAIWAKKVGLAKGSNIGFEGNRAITRAELAIVFANYMDYKSMIIKDGSVDGFADSSLIPTWAQAGMKKAIGAGLIKGTDENKLNPTKNITRAELAQIYYNFSPLLSDKTTGEVVGFDRFGNFKIDITAQNLYNNGFKIYDTMTIKLGEYSVDAPLVSSAAMVDFGDPFLYAPSGISTGQIYLCVNFHNASTIYKNAKLGDAASVELKQSGGHLQEFEYHNFEISFNREDYASDEIFANFRNNTVGNIAEGVLYRSCSPVDNSQGRAAYANALAEKAGIATIIDLTDSNEEMEAYFTTPDFKSTFYKGMYEDGNVICLKMAMDPLSDEFRGKVKAGLEFIIANEGPYLVHCTEGKDRAGYVSALLGALMGGTLEEIKDDYLTTFMNYYHVEYGSEQYNHIGERNVYEFLIGMAGLERGSDISKLNLVTVAENYLKDIGMTNEQITSLKARLSTPVAAANPAA